MRRCTLRPDEYPALALLDGPARERIESRRAHSFTGAQVKAGVMPGAAYGVANHQAVGKWAVIVRAVSPHREDLRAAAHQKNLLVPDMAQEFAAIGKLAERKALREIGSGRLVLVVCHCFLHWRPACV